MSKIRKNITIDEEFDHFIRYKLGMPLSEFVNNTLKEAFNVSDEITELRKEIYEHENALISLRAKLCKLEREEAAAIKNRKGYEECMVILLRIHDNMGEVGENQIRNVADNFSVNFDGLLSYCKEQGLNVSKGLEAPRKTKLKNGGNMY